MKTRPMLSLLCGAALLCGSTVLTADDAPSRPPRPQAEKGGFGGQRGGGMMKGRNPMAGLAYQVKAELDAYNADKSDANYAKLEAAVKAAAAKSAAQRKEMLEKRLEQLKNELANFDQNQEKQVADFLAKAKAGELKLPERPKRGGRQQGKQPAIPGTGTNR